MDNKERLTQLNEYREKARQGGGLKRLEAQHSKGKLNARERLDLLFDGGTFVEIDPFVTHRCIDFGMAEQIYAGDSVVVGYGKINNRLSFAFSQDFTVLGGSLSEVASKKICKVMDLAASNGAPFVAILDSGGARIQEGIDSMNGYGEIFTRNTLYSGVIPQISVIVGPTAGGAVYSPAITDFVLMVRGLGQSYITGPDVVEAVTGEKVSLESLGGADVNASKSGNCHLLYENEESCFMGARRLLSFLPQNQMEKAIACDCSDDPSRREEGLIDIIPDNSAQAYDMKQIILKVVDNADFMEIHQKFAGNFIVGFARLAGESVGVLAQQPSYMAGVLDIDASDKAARFVRTCDCFNIPLVTFVDVPGYMPGTDQEFRGIIRHGAKLLFAYAEASVPKVSVIVRKAYGGAYIAMSSKSLGGDINYAWPMAEIAVMGSEAAVGFVNRREINEATNYTEAKQRLATEYRERFANPYIAAARGYVDDVIDPSDTRYKLIQALQMLKNKDITKPARKHGNIPL